MAQISINEIRKAPNKTKENLIPAVGRKLRMIAGPGNAATFKIVARNVGKLRFSCELIGVETDVAPSEEIVASRIITPEEKGIIKNMEEEAKTPGLILIQRRDK